MKRWTVLLLAAITAAFLMPGNIAFAADSDSDGWDDADEATIGTDPNRSCGLNAWPPDITSNGFIDTGDLGAVTNDFGEAVPPAPARHDIDHTPSGFIDSGDIGEVTNLFGVACTTQYHIDPSGSDSNNGLSTSTPWQTVGKVNAVADQSLKSFRFKRGGTWSEELTLDTASVTQVDTYGTGALPKIDTNQNGDCVTVTDAVNTTIQHLHVDDCEFSGVNIHGGGTRNLVINDLRATGNIAGVKVSDDVDRTTPTTIKGSNFIDNNRMSVDTPGGDDDSGAWGILMNGGKLVVENSFFSGHDSHSYDYTRDGAAIEPYSCNASVTLDLKVFKNRAVDNDTFLETPLAHASCTPHIQLRAEENHIYGSLAIQKGYVLMHRNDAGSNVVIQRDTIRFTGSNRAAVIADLTIITFQNNIVYNSGTGGDSFAHANTSTIGYNIFKPASHCPSSACGGTNQENVDPLLVSTTNRHLQDTSPAIDAGDPTFSFCCTNADQDGNIRTLDTAQDIGADEWVEQ